MKIKYQGHKRRTQAAIELWVKVATDYNAGFSPEQIRHRYTNPKTGKPYSRGYIYWVLNKVKNLPIKELEG